MPSPSGPSAAAPGAAAPPAMSGKRLQAEYPNAHKILSELHLMKRLNEELFMQIEETRCALNRVADSMPSAATALAGVRHILDPDTSSAPVGGQCISPERVGGVATNPSSVSPAASTSGLPAPEAAHCDNTAAANDDAVERTKRRFFQFVDETLVKAKQHASGGVGGAHARNFEEEYACLRTKVLAHENAQHIVSMSKQRLEDAQNELRLCRTTLRDTSATLEQVQRERDGLRIALAAAQKMMPAPPPPAAPLAADGAARSQPAEKRVDLFDAMFDDLALKRGKVVGGRSLALDQRQESVGGSEDPKVLIANLVATIVDLEVQLRGATEKVPELTRANERLEATVSAAQLEAEALRVALAEQQDVASALRRDVAALESGRDALTDGIAMLQETVKGLESQAALDRDAVKRLSTAAADQRTATSSVASLTTKLNAVQEALDRATANGLVEKQRREQSEREVFALQRMLNSVDLDREQSTASMTATGKHAHGAALDERRREGSTGQQDMPSAAGKGGGEQLEETVLRLRLSLKEAIRARKVSEMELQQAHRTCRMYRCGVASLGLRCVSAALHHEYHRWLLCTPRQAKDIGPVPLLDDHPPRAVDVEVAPHVVAESAAPVVTAAAVVQRTVTADGAMQTDGPSPIDGVCVNPSPLPMRRWTGDVSMDGGHATPLPSTDVAILDGGVGCPTCSTLGDRVRELLAEKKVQQNLLLELRDALRTMIAGALPVDAGEGDEPRGEEEDGDEETDADLGSNTRHHNLSANDGSANSHEHHHALHNREYTPSTFPVQQRTVSRPATKSSATQGTGGGPARLMRGLFGRLVGGQQHPRPQSAVNTDPTDVVSRQQLQNVQRLLEGQLRENMALHERLAALTKGP